jgi:hypothetical protein
MTTLRQKNFGSELESEKFQVNHAVCLFYFLRFVRFFPFFILFYGSSS